jgi:hypothetical protein
MPDVISPCAARYRYHTGVDPAALLKLIEAAADVYKQVLRRRHIEHAEKTLARRCTFGAA